MKFTLGTPEEVAAEIAWGLGISVYVSPDGKITQHGPGKEIRPPSTAKPIYYEARQSPTSNGG